MEHPFGGRPSLLDTAEHLEPESHDPKHLNDNATIVFEDVIGETSNARTMDCIWPMYRRTFDTTMNVCYKALTVVCGLPLVFCYGLEFACLSFDIIWCITPSVKATKIYLMSVKSIYSIFIKCICDPIWESMGHFFSNIKVSNSSV